MDEDRLRAMVDSALSQLTEAAMGLHEMFTTFVAGGFTEDQALSLVAKIVVNSNSEGD